MLDSLADLEIEHITGDMLIAILQQLSINVPPALIEPLLARAKQVGYTTFAELTNDLQRFWTGATPGIRNDYVMCPVCDTDILAYHEVTSQPKTAPSLKRILGESIAASPANAVPYTAFHALSRALGCDYHVVDPVIHAVSGVTPKSLGVALFSALTNKAPTLIKRVYHDNHQCPNCETRFHEKTLVAPAVKYADPIFPQLQG